MNQEPPGSPLVSIVIPVLRDTRELEAQLDRLGCRAVTPEPTDGGRAYEVIVANGDPADPGVEDARRRFPRARWTASEAGRARQMNAGAELASGRWLLFLHADARLEPGWVEQIRHVDGEPDVVGGCFAFALDSPARMARVIETGVRWRVRWLGLAYGDQGLFVRRAIFDELGGYRPLAIMEDLDLVRRLRRHGRVWCSALPIHVSPRRWERDGWVRRSSLNVLLVVLYYGGVSPDRLARSYYNEARPTPTPTVATTTAASFGDGRPDAAHVAVIIPAMNEAEAITAVLAEIPTLVTSVTVVDNGSTDATAERAQAAGATVVAEPRPGYGRACLVGLAATNEADVVVFLDADRTEYPDEMNDLVIPILEDRADFVLGYRGGAGRPAAARLGTELCVRLINALWGTTYRDLGPFRAIRRDGLDRLQMADQTWGWTIEMQVKAAEAGLRTLEVPIRQRERIGQSKISGTLRGTVRAGTRMLITIASLWWTRRSRMS